MGRAHEPLPALRVLAAFGQDPRALDWARRTAGSAWGPVALTSPVFDFSETDYYQPTMGGGLKKVFFAFQQPIDPAELAGMKVQTNTWEEAYADRANGSAPEHARMVRATLRTPDVRGSGPAPPPPNGSRRDPNRVARPLNLDPGYLTEAKLVLASTKDHAHRIYLDHGIYAEVTLHYRHHAWRYGDWTYPDYRRDDYHRFFTQCRDYLRRHTAKGGPP